MIRRSSPRGCAGRKGPAASRSSSQPLRGPTCRNSSAPPSVLAPGYCTSPWGFESVGGQARLPHPPSRSPLAGPFWPPDRSLRAGDPHLGKVTEVMPPTRRDRYFPAQDPSVGLRWPPLPTARSRPKWHESGTKLARAVALRGQGATGATRRRGRRDPDADRPPHARTRRLHGAHRGRAVPAASCRSAPQTSRGGAVTDRRCAFQLRRSSPRIRAKRVGHAWDALSVARDGQYFWSRSAEGNEPRSAGRQR